MDDFYMWISWILIGIMIFMVGAVVVRWILWFVRELGIAWRNERHL